MIRSVGYFFTGLLFPFLFSFAHTNIFFHSDPASPDSPLAWRITGCVGSFFVCLLVLLLFLPQPALCKVFFHSDFERGETFTAEDLSPDQRSIRLVPNFRLDEWPVDGGQGIVEGNLPSAADTFTYVIRNGPILKGVRGIVRKHPQWADIRTGNLMEWYNSTEAEARESMGKIAVTGREPLFGNYSAAFNTNFDSKIALSREPLDGIKKLFVRFYVLFSPEVIRRTSVPWRIFEMRMLFRLIPTLGVQPSAGAGPYFDIAPEETVFRREVFPNNRIPIVAEKKYCVEYQVDFSDSNQAVVTLYIEQALQVREFCKPGIRYGTNYMGFNISLPGYPASGKFFVDEFVCSDTAAGPLPEKPVLQVSDKEIRILPFSDADNHPRPVATQWQAHASNSWLLPLFNGGRTKPDTAFAAFSWLGIDTGDTIRASMGKGGKYFSRVRYENQAGNWSEWSTPVLFRPAPEHPYADSLRPRIHKIFFARPGSGSPLKSIVAGAEYDLYVYPSDPQEWSNLGYCDIYLCDPAEEDEGNYANRGGNFQPGKFCMISYSLADNDLWEKRNPGTDRWSRVTGRKGLYVNDSGNLYMENRKQGWARARIKLPEAMPPGHLLVKAFAVNDLQLISPMHRQLMPVVDSAASEKRNGIFYWIALAGVGMVGILAGGLAIRFLWRGTDKNNSKAGEKQEPAVAPLEFDSPYDENIKKARDYILANFNKDLLVEDVAKAVGVSKGWLGKVFVKATNKKISQYINEVRIDNAKKLLEETKLNISEIAFKTGFNSPERFAQVFNQLTRQTASEYREMNKKS